MILLAATSLQGFSQEKTSLWKWLKDRAVTPAKALDPEAVYQPAPTFHIGISGDLRRAGMSQKCQNTYGDEDMAETYVLTDVTAYDLLYEAINSSGRFFRWSTSLKFCVKF